MAHEKSRKLAKKLQRQAQDYQKWSDAGEKKKRGAADKGFVSHKAAKVMKRSLVARRRMEEAVENARTEKPFEKDAVKIEFGSSKGRSLLRAEDLVVGYSKGSPLTRELSFDLWAGDRLAVLGPNGCGKTALLRTVLGEIPPCAATFVSHPPRRSATSTRTIASCLLTSRPWRRSLGPDARRPWSVPSWAGWASGERP